MNRKAIVAVGCVLGLASIGTAFAVGLSGESPRKSVEFFSGHTHDDAGTHGGPQHSGGTDRYGCHNGSVPYHCH